MEGPIKICCMAVHRSMLSFEAVSVIYYNTFLVEFTPASYIYICVSL